jgi:hypothetical protein
MQTKVEEAVNADRGGNVHAIAAQFCMNVGSVHTVVKNLEYLKACALSNSL